MATKKRKRRNRKIVKPDEIYERSDGTITFSDITAAIADRRKRAQAGRIQKVLGTDGTFSDTFKIAILSDHQDVLERKHLELELKNYKRVIKALSSFPDDKQAKRLRRKIRRDPSEFRGSNILCPIWKNNHIYELTGAAIPRYLFPEKSSELYMVTVIFSFAENLYQLEQAIQTARQDMDSLISDLTKKRRGLFIAGCFEPDLKTHEELTRPTSGDSKLLKQIGIQTPDTGGWILTGHFIIRAPYHQWIRDELNCRYPCKGWKRVQFDEIDRSKTLAQHMLDILDYAGKYPRPIFNYPTRGEAKEAGDEKLNAMQSAFYGPSLPDVDDQSFGIDTAIRQWALFMDRLGERNIYYAKESTHAQKWYSRSEWNCIRENGDDLFERRGDTLHKIELHRDTEFASDRIRPNLNGRCRILRTRNLRFDEEWCTETDLGDGPYSGRPYTYDQWILRE